MISPWMVGRIGDAAGSDWFYTNANVGDQNEDGTTCSADYYLRLTADGRMLKGPAPSRSSPTGRPSARGRPSS
jgi:hypothetical protein